MIQNDIKTKQLESVLKYVSAKNECKSKLILNYFGEQKKENCGICSYCITLKSKTIHAISTTKQIILALEENSLDSRSLEKITGRASNEVIFALQELLEYNVIEIQSNNQYRLKK